MDFYERSNKQLRPRYVLNTWDCGGTCAALRLHVVRMSQVERKVSGSLFPSPQKCRPSSGSFLFPYHPCRDNNNNSTIQVTLVSRTRQPELHGPVLSQNMDKQTLQDWLTWSFSPSLSAILITLLVSLSLPILIHIHLYRKRASTVLPCFLLAGPSGAGKTTLLTHVCRTRAQATWRRQDANQAVQLDHGKAAPTHTSQESQTVYCSLPHTVTAKSSQYRAVDDPSREKERHLEVIDTPGHGKLRHHALTALTSTSALRGLIFVVDAAALSSAAGLTEAAIYLHDVLLTLQKRHTTAKTSKGPASIPVLIAANKLDLFTALPAQLVKKKLQDEITNIRATRAKGLLDSGAGAEGDDEEREWLGEGGEGAFVFKQMEESEIEVVVLGGNVTGDKPHVDEWWNWIAQQM